MQDLPRVSVSDGDLYPLATRQLLGGLDGERLVGFFGALLLRGAEGGWI